MKNSKFSRFTTPSVFKNITITIAIGHLFLMPPILLSQNTARYWFEKGLAETNLVKKVAFYDAAIRLDPTLDVAYGNRGYIQVQLGKTPEAMSDYNKAIELNPKFASVFHNRGALKNELGRFSDALTDLTKAISLKPNERVYQDRGKVNFNLQHYQDAVHDYSMSIQIFRKKIDYAFEIDASSQEISHLESALAYVFFYRSGAFEKLGQSTNAKKDLEIYNTLITTYRY